MFEKEYLRKKTTTEMLFIIKGRQNFQEWINHNNNKWEPITCTQTCDRLDITMGTLVWIRVGCLQFIKPK